MNEGTEGGREGRDGRHDRRRYPCTCAACGTTFDVCQSILMEGFGVNSGRATCQQCGTCLHLRMEPDLGGCRMVSQPYSEHLDKLRAEAEAGTQAGTEARPCAALVGLAEGFV